MFFQEFANQVCLTYDERSLSRTFDHWFNLCSMQRKTHLEDYGKILLFPQMLKGRKLLDHLRFMKVFALSVFDINNLVIILMLYHSRYLGVASYTHNIIILSLFNSILHFIFIIHKLIPYNMSNLIPLNDIGGLILIWGCHWIEVLNNLEMLAIWQHGPLSCPLVLCLHIFVLMSFVHFII